MPETVETGAVASLGGGGLVTSGEAIVAAVESRLSAAGRHGETSPELLDGAVPVIDRSPAMIVPLAWVPEAPPARVADDQDLSRIAGELWSAVRSACGYRHGEGIGLALDAETAGRAGYASELVRTGVRRADWWSFGAAAVVLAVYGEPLPAPLSRVALHVVPIAWVSERSPRAAKAPKVPRLDWSWADAVAIAEHVCEAPTDASTGTGHRP
ncbi:hypothetical protein ACFP59_05045 [Microbacterium koreense]